MLNYASNANIEEVMKFYNPGDKTFETGFNDYSFQKLQIDARQINFVRETFFERWEEGGWCILQERFSNVSKNRCFKLGHFHKTLPVRKNFISSINLGQTSYLNIDKFRIGTIHILS